MTDAIEIYCPRCAWHPTAHSRWVCTPKIGGCGFVWNTFDTRGICPECSWKWEITMCHSCGQFSPHEQWYHDPTPPEREKIEEDLEVPA